VSHELQLPHRKPFHSEHLGGVSYVNSNVIFITIVIYHY